ncbi:Fc.00g055570.m01.CDS01 [Cosmosporella sp. VM-42]
MNFTFNADGSDITRPRRARKACLECRRRKERCYTRLSPFNQRQDACLRCQKREIVCSHGTPRPLRASPPESQDQSYKTASATRSQSPTSVATDLGIDANTDQSTASETRIPQTTRFIGHLNPEAHLLAKTRPSSPNSCQDQEKDHLGIWCRDQVAGSVGDPRTVAANSLERYLNVIREFEIPDENVCAALCNIYFSSIHQFIPIVDEKAFRYNLSQLKLSIPLLLAVLLAASRDHQAQRYLWFTGSAGERQLLQPREFSQRIYTHLASLLKAEAETDKMTLIQVHSLMSLHCEGPEGNEIASLNLLTAIHYLQVLGIHLPRADETDKSGRTSTVFWCVCDRLNAAYNGRPTIIHERDMANKPSFECLNAHDRKVLAPFIVWLKITNLLDKTISYYRPIEEPTSTGWEIGFPSFDEILSGEDLEMEPRLMHVLEIYYHAVAILTSRFRDWNPVTASNASSIRQALSTLRMLQIAEDLSLDELPALPIIPYTMTLCLTVAYRQCRQSVSTTADRATRHLTTAYTILESLASQWWMAEAMSKLGKRAMEKTRKVSRGSGRQSANQISTQNVVLSGSTPPSQRTRNFAAKKVNPSTIRNETNGFFDSWVSGDAASADMSFDSTVNQDSPAELCARVAASFRTLFKSLSVPRIVLTK